jgi:hypothetical protein
MSELRPWLTIVAWPEGYGRSEIATLVADPLGTDARTAELHVGAAPPRIYGQPEDAAARAAADAIIAAGGDAFVVTVEELRALGPTLKVRDLGISPGGLRIDPWRGMERTIDPADIDVVIKASSGEADISLDSGSAVVDAAEIAVYGAAFGAYGVAAGMYSGFFRNSTEQEPTPIESHRIDFHTRNGVVYQIDGDKFGFEILGDLRGHSDHDNIRQMTELLTHLQPEVIVDPWFRYWKAPTNHHKLKLPMMTLNEEDPAFAFYSRWAALMYRHVVHGPDGSSSRP